MALLILIFLIAAPLAEIYVFIEVGERIGALSTILAIVLTALIGTFLLRLQGLQTLARARQQMDRGELPARALFDGLCLLMAGALLLVPGFITDVIGFLLFAPPLRNLIYRRLAHRFEQRGFSGQFHTGSGAGAGRNRRGPGGVIIDGEFEEVGDPDDPPNDPPGPGQGRLPQ